MTNLPIPPKPTGKVTRLRQPDAPDRITAYVCESCGGFGTNPAMLHSAGCEAVRKWHEWNERWPFDQRDLAPVSDPEPVIMLDKIDYVREPASPTEKERR